MQPHICAQSTRLAVLPGAPSSLPEKMAACERGTNDLGPSAFRVSLPVFSGQSTSYDSKMTTSDGVHTETATLLRCIKRWSPCCCGDRSPERRCIHSLLVIPFEIYPPTAERIPLIGTPVAQQHRYEPTDQPTRTISPLYILEEHPPMLPCSFRRHRMDWFRYRTRKRWTKTKLSYTLGTGDVAFLREGGYTTLKNPISGLQATWRRSAIGRTRYVTSLPLMFDRTDIRASLTSCTTQTSVGPRGRIKDRHG